MLAHRVGIQAPVQPSSGSITEQRKDIKFGMTCLQLTADITSMMPLQLQYDTGPLQIWTHFCSASMERANEGLPGNNSRDGHYARNSEYSPAKYANESEDDVEIDDEPEEQ